MWGIPTNPAQLKSYPLGVLEGAFGSGKNFNRNERSEEENLKNFPLSELDRALWGQIHIKENMIFFSDERVRPNFFFMWGQTFQ